jgi:adenylylsulfate kinase
VRQHLSHNLGFSKRDRDENIRRIGYVAQLLVQQQVIVLVAAISPYRAARACVREEIGNFLEVYVNASLETCIQRDPKQLYARALRGELSHFTGIDDPYEAPFKPDVECRTEQESCSESAAKVLAAIVSMMRTLDY